MGFLVIHQKQKKTLDEIMNDLCPVLSVQQLYRIATMYWDHKFGTETVAQVCTCCWSFLCPHYFLQPVPAACAPVAVTA